MVPLHYQSLTQVCRDIKSGARSSLDVTHYILARIEALEPDLAAFALVAPERALRKAEQEDERRRRGEPLGLLHGVPLAIKDLLYTDDMVTASGTRVMADFVPEYTATVVTKLEQAGAVIVGKTQLTEGAFGNHHPDITPPRNPYDPGSWPGVSSSGSGVAVAAGMSYAALGSDTGGSIRFPSACCGLVGIKPTYGRVSKHGAFPLADSLDHIGPMTRSVEDAARVLSAIAGHDPLDPNSADVPLENYLQSAADLSGWRVGVDWRYATSGVDDALVAVQREVIERCVDLGAQIVDVSIPDSYATLVAGWPITCAVECAAAHREYFPRMAHLYGPALRELIELGLQIPGDRYDALELSRAQFQMELEVLFEGIDVLVAPPMPVTTPAADVMEAGYDDEAHAPFINFTAPFDYSGHPTLSLPVRLSAAGLPLGVQLIAGAFREDRLIHAGRALETCWEPLPRP